MTVNIRADRERDPDGDPLNYSWSATGGRVNGNGPQVRWTAGRGGAGQLHGHRPSSMTGTAGRQHARQTRVNPRPNLPPTVIPDGRSRLCVGRRTGAFHGDGPTRTAIRSTIPGGPMAAISSPAGTSGDLDTTGLAPGNYTVTVRVEDGRGGAADASKAMEVQAPPPPPQATKLDGCDFKPANGSRVDNVCKRVLDDIALRLQNEARVDPRDRRLRRSQGARTDQSGRPPRADNAAQYLADKGVDRSRIITRTGAGQAGAGQQNRHIDIICVPQGATY